MFTRRVALRSSAWGSSSAAARVSSSFSAVGAAGAAAGGGWGASRASGISGTSVGSGTAVIGLDVKYGNRVFVRPNRNGYLVDFDVRYVDGDDEPLIADMARRIVDIFQDRKRLEGFHRESYEAAGGFLQGVVAEMWRGLLLTSDRDGDGARK